MVKLITQKFKITLKLKKMNKEKLNNIISMLNSDDNENAIVALNVLENINHKENLVQLLLAYKYSKNGQVKWSTNAPKAFNFVTKFTHNENPNITFNDIFQAILQKKLPSYQMDMFLENFSEHLTNQCRLLGYDFIEQINVTTKKL
jgi:hypothetical protein